MKETSRMAVNVGKSRSSSIDHPLGRGGWCRVGAVPRDTARAGYIVTSSHHNNYTQIIHTLKHIHTRHTQCSDMSA